MTNYRDLLRRKPPSEERADQAEAELRASGLYMFEGDQFLALGLLWDLQNRHPGSQLGMYPNAAGTGYVLESEDRLASMLDDPA